MLSQQAGQHVKMEGKENNLIELIRADPYFQPIHAQLGSMLDPSKYTGCCARQVDEFVRQVVRPILAKYESRLAGTSQLLL